MTGAWAYVRLRDRDRARAARRGARFAATLVAGAVARACSSIWPATAPCMTSQPFEGLFARESLVITLGYPLALAAVMVGITLIRRAGSSCPLRQRSDPLDRRHQLRDLPDPLRGDLGRAPGALAAAATDRVGRSLAWCAIVYPVSIIYAYLSARVPRAAGEALGASLRAPRAGRGRRRGGPLSAASRSPVHRALRPPSPSVSIVIADPQPRASGCAWRWTASSRRTIRTSSSW